MSARDTWLPVAPHERAVADLIAFAICGAVIQELSNRPVVGRSNGNVARDSGTRGSAASCMVSKERGIMRACRTGQSHDWLLPFKLATWH